MPSSFESQLFLSRPYLTKNQIMCAQRNTVTDRRTYNQKKLGILNFLSELCIKLELPRKTLETAMYFYQRYHLFNSFETELCYTVATSCLVLSCKQVETVKKVNEIAILSLQIRNMIKINPNILESFKKRLYQIELRILESCNFDYRINNNVYIDEYIIKIGKTYSFDFKVCRLAWCVAYDVLKLDVILMVPPPIIALATIKIAYELYNLKHWPLNSHEAIGADEVIVDDIMFHIIDFYINAFDLCDLKYNLPADLDQISIETFIQMKSQLGPEINSEDVPDDYVKYDIFLNKPRQYSVQERRYVLSSQFLKEELESLQNV